MNPPSLPNAHHAAPRSPAPPHPSPPPQPPPHPHHPHPSYALPSHPPHHQPRSYDKHYSHDSHRYDQNHSPQPYQTIPRASHLHLPGVHTYIEHYHYYNFNGNCTVQQASGDGQPNTIRMVSPNQPHTNLPSQIANERPPAQQPTPASPHPPPESHRHHLYHGPDPFSRQPRHRSSLPQSHLAPLSNPHPMSTPVHLPPHSSFLGGSRFPKPPPSIQDPPPIPPQPPILPRLRTSDQEPPILAPLQSSVPASLSPLHAEEKTSDRPAKKSRLSRGPVNSLTGHDASSALPTSVALGAGSESNCQSAAEDRVLAMQRGSAYGIQERPVATTNSSSPSRSDYPLVARTEGFERNNGGAGSSRAVKSGDESQSNDWEAVVEMYTTGKGTEDGVALKLITKGDGRRVSDRKLLEKRRTIGKTYECLGVERFERAIGYKWENGVRRKQKMYHVISRCRVVNAMRKAGEPIPTDCEELTRLINGRIAEKEALKAGMARRNSAGGSTIGGGRFDGGGGVAVLGGGMGHSLDETGRMRGLGHHMRDGIGPGGSGELGGLRGGRLEHERDVGGRGSIGHGRSSATNGYDDGGLAGRDEDEIRPGRAHDGGRYA